MDTTDIASRNTDDNGGTPFDLIRQTRDDGTEFWSARDLMEPLGYASWRKFDGTIERAKISAGNQGYDIDSEFVQVAGVVASDNPSGTERKDYELSRSGAYLVAMNGDPRKQQISDAQGYFVGRTREAENAVRQRELTPTELALMVIEAEKRKVEAQRALSVVVPKAEKFEAWQNSSDTMYIEEWGKHLGLTRTRAFEHLRAMGVLSRRPRTDGIDGYLNVPNAKFTSLFELRQEYVDTIDRYELVPRLTPRGAVLLAELLVRRGRLSAEALGYMPMPALPGEAA